MQQEGSENFPGNYDDSSIIITVCPFLGIGSKNALLQSSDSWTVVSDAQQAHFLLVLTWKWLSFREILLVIARYIIEVLR